MISHRNDLSAQANLLSEDLSPHLRRTFEAVSEQGATCWLTTVPIVCFSERRVS